MAPDFQHLPGLVERATADTNPMAALEALTELRHQLDLVERAQVARALGTGHTFTSIAAPLAISRQAAHRRYRDLAPPPPLRQPPTLSPEARTALQRARQEAARQGAQSIESEHLLVAVARTGVLSLDIEAARRTFGPPVANAPEPAGLHPALRARLTRASGTLELQHLLRAALEDPGGGARRLLERLGIQPQAVLDGL
jgi:hypothetical protein